MKQEEAGMSNLLTTAVAVCPESKAWKEEEITFHINGFLHKKKTRKEKIFTFTSSFGFTFQVPNLNHERSNTCFLGQALIDITMF